MSERNEIANNWLHKYNLKARLQIDCEPKRSNLEEREMTKPRNRPVTPEALSDAQDEFQNESDRGCALLGAAQVEHLLGQAIQKHLERGEETGQRLLLAPDAPLGTFSSRTLAAYSLGIIGPTTKGDIDVIRDIRNDFAHTVASLDFSNQSIAGRCNNLKLPYWFERKYGEDVMKLLSTPRMLFITAVVMITGDLKVLVGLRTSESDEPPVTKT